MMPVVRLLSGPLWGGLADATRPHRSLLTFTVASARVCVPAIFLTTDLLTLSILVVMCAFLKAPIMPLVDSAVLQMLGGGQAHYGQPRLWGTIGCGSWGALPATAVC